MDTTITFFVGLISMGILLGTYKYYENKPQKDSDTKDKADIKYDYKD